MLLKLNLSADYFGLSFHLVWKTSEKCLNMESCDDEATQQHKTTKYYIYTHVRQIKQQILTLKNIEPANIWHFCLKN